MRWLPRKLTFQLTPLLDLLLIVLFAQYMEANRINNDERTRNELRVQQEFQEERERLNTQIVKLDDETKRLNTERKQLTEAEVKLQQKEADLQKKWKQILDQQTNAANTAAELFQLPDELVEKALKHLEKNRSPEELIEIRKAFRDLAKKRGTEVIHHLLTYRELRKRCDIWQIHIATNGEIILYTGKERLKFRANSSKQFETKLFNQYKKIPQPKGLVIILLSVGNIRADVEKAALTGLPLATDRMRSDSNSRTRFEYAVLGYVKKSPIPTIKP